MSSRKFTAVLFSILFVCTLTVSAQVKTISGEVVHSESGNPIAGASVTVRGTTLGTITNSEGEYVLNVPNNATHLIFSFIGMKTEVKPIISAQVNAQLTSDYIGLEEVVILGYNKKDKDEITGSVVQIDGEEIAGVPVTNFSQALQGRVPGLNISTTSGTPGSVQDIRIRGVGSITAGNEPLFVIDGVPVINEDFSGSDIESSLSALTAINSNDIEKITVLKDASATSAYGARGANGVIVITTKKGKMGDTRFNASATVGFQNNAVEGMVPLTGAQKAELLQEAAFNTFGDPYGFPEKEVYSFLNWNGQEGNWNNLLINDNALVQNYAVSASGGDDQSSFYASLGYNNTEATVYGSDFERITGKLNYNRNFSGKVRFSTNISVSNIRQNGIVEPSLYFRNPHLTRYFMSPWEQPYLDDGVTLNTNANPYNTLYTIENDILTNDLTRGIANSFVEWLVTPKFKFKSLFAADYNIAAYHNYVNRVHGDGKNIDGFTNQSVSRNFNFVIQNSIDYNFDFDDHSFEARAILEYQENKYNYLSGHGENFTLDNLMYIESAGSNFDASSSFTDWKHVSYLGMLNYKYAGKYITDFTYRSEGSSKFVPGKRFGNFWAVGAAWNITQEDFLNDNQIINNLRLKASYGISGNSAIGINSYQPLLSFDANYAGEGAVYPGQFGNSNLTWEKNRNLNIGVDYAFLNSVVDGSLAYYYRNTYDLLQSVPLSRTTGQQYVMMNAGAMVNKGVEASLNIAVIRSDELNINFSANVATVQNEVTELATDANGKEINIETTTQKVAVGQPVFGWYMKKWAGVNPETGSAQWYINGAGNEVTGNYFDPNIEKVWLGSPIPKYTGGLALHADFKEFFADASLYFAGGHNIFEDFSLFTHHSGKYTILAYNGAETLMDRWQEPGDVTDVPKVIYGYNNDSQISSRFLYEGDYARLKNLVVGYNIPSELTNSIGFDGIAVSVRGTNLFTWVKDDRLKFDPEVPATGLTSFNTPPVKSIVFGVNLKF